MADTHCTDNATPDFVAAIASPLDLWPKWYKPRGITEIRATRAWVKPENLYEVGLVDAAVAEKAWDQQSRLAKGTAWASCGITAIAAVSAVVACFYQKWQLDLAREQFQSAQADLTSLAERQAVFEKRLSAVEKEQLRHLLLVPQTTSGPQPPLPQQNITTPTQGKLPSGETPTNATPGQK